MNEFSDLEAIFRAGLAKVDPYAMLLDCVHIEGGGLKVRTETEEERIDLAEIDRIYVLGIGKAAAPMARAMEEILGERLAGGLIATKYGYAEALHQIRVIEAGHPVPDENSLRAGQAMQELGRGFSAKTLAIILVSGGGSALCEALPAYAIDSRNVQITLDDLRRTTQALLACGATINEINCIRKHLSRLKGGQFLRVLQPARSLTLILSDVVGDRLDAIASGLTAPDPTTFHEAKEIIERYAVQERLPEPVLNYIELGMAGKVPETPKPGDPLFTTSRNLLIGTNLRALGAAAEKARSLGYHTAVLSSQLVGEAREAAKFLLGIARDIRKQDLLVAKPACLIVGGETTVTLHGNGLGGRNQEMALSLLNEMEKDPAQCAGITFLAASTDGSDGPTDAAGAFASAGLLEAARGKELEIGKFLDNNDSYHFFEQIGGLLKTGPTRTNVCDVQILIIR